jgi:hypothetical protein
MAGKHFRVVKIDFLVTEAAQIADDVKSKIVEHPMLPSEVKTGCQSHFRSYGGKTLPGRPKLVDAGGRSTDSS